MKFSDYSTIPFDTEFTLMLKNHMLKNHSTWPTWLEFVGLVQVKLLIIIC